MVSVLRVMRSFCVTSGVAAGGRTKKHPKPWALCVLKLLRFFVSVLRNWSSHQSLRFSILPCVCWLYIIIYCFYLLCDCSEIYATYFNRYSNVCWSHWYQDKSKPAQRSWIFMGSNKMYICFYSGLKLYLTGCLCLLFRSQTAVYMN